MPLIIGSEALSLIKPNREVHDLDIVAYRSQLKFLYRQYGGQGRVIYRGKSTCTFMGADKRVEVFFADDSPAWTYLFDKLSIASDSKVMWHSSLNVLFSIKSAHIDIPHNFEKHIYDYVWMGKKLNWKNHYPKFTALLRREAKKRISKRSRRQPKFSQLVPYDNVIQGWCRVNDAATMVSHWGELTTHDKCVEMVRWCEFVALKERIIPFLFIGGAPFHNSYRALKYALRRLCTNYKYLPDELKEFARQHYFEILRYFDTNFDTNFVVAYFDGKIASLDNYTNTLYNTYSVGDGSK